MSHEGDCRQQDEEEMAELRAEVERLRAYLPLARASAKWCTTVVGNKPVFAAEWEVHRASSALSPEERAWLMDCDK